MRLSRVYVDAKLAAGSQVELPKNVAQHLLKVLRLRPGAAVVLFNGDGHDYHGTLSSNREVQLQRRVAAVTPSKLRITLAQGLCRGEKMDLVLQKATELGVSAIQPLNTQRSEVRLNEERQQRRMAHWHQVIAAACEQCGRADLPQLLPPTSLPHWLAELGADADAQRLVLDPDGEHSPGQLQPSTSVLIVVGPEGGLEDRELGLCAAQGFTRLRLGPRVLRTETAGLALIAGLGCLWGDLG